MNIQVSQHQMGLRKYIYWLIIGLLVLLWLYTVCDKLYDFAAFKLGMRSQIFSRNLATLLTYLLPAVEWLALCLLLYPKLRLAGLYLSALLLLAFTLYVAFAVLGLYPRRPCTCGGLFRALSWRRHLLLNFFLTTLSLYGVYLSHPLRKEVSGA